MKTSSALVVLTLMLDAFITPSADFLTEQKRFPRVRAAIEEKESTVTQDLDRHGISLSTMNLLLIAYKDSDELELYAKNKTESTYILIRSYRICSRSGTLGPKRKQGDRQVPEGFYHITHFNPASNFYLSLGLNYPNLADRRKTTATDPGGDIYIHGACVTIGCLPMTDDKIKEVYVYAVHAKNNGQTRIPVYIFPFRMTDPGVQRYREQYGENSELIAFWSTLKRGYDQFMSTKVSLTVVVDENGEYLF